MTLAVPIRNTTFAKVTFYSFDKGKITVPAVGGGAGLTRVSRRRNLAGPIVAMQTTKNLGPPSGSWSITLKPFALDGIPWPDLITDGDWCKIQVVKNGFEWLLMAGRIDEIAVGINAESEGSGTVVVTITGRDLGATPEDTPLYFNPYDSLHSNLVGKDMIDVLDKAGGTFEGPPEVVVSALLFGSLTVGSYGIPPQVPPGLFGPIQTLWSDVIDRRFVESLRGFLAAPQVLTPGVFTPIWQFADQFRNAAMNEMWLDTDPTSGQGEDFVAGRLFLREKPFENLVDLRGSPWFTKVVAHSVSLDSVTGISVSKGKNRINHVFVLGQLPSSFGGDPMPLYPPTFNPTSIGRWGLRKLDVTSPYLSTGSTVASQFVGWRGLVRNWNLINAEHWNGLIQLGEIRPDIQIGHKISLRGGPPAQYPFWSTDTNEPDTQMTFYVEGVQHGWSEGPSGSATTQLQVSRGYQEGLRLPAMTVEALGWSDISISGSANQKNPAIDLGNTDVFGGP